MFNITNLDNAEVIELPRTYQKCTVVRVLVKDKRASQDGKTIYSKNFCTIMFGNKTINLASCLKIGEIITLQRTMMSFDKYGKVTFNVNFLNQIEKRGFAENSYNREFLDVHVESTDSSTEISSIFKDKNNLEEWELIPF